MEIFCTKESNGCIQESISLTILKMEQIGLQMKFPEGFYQMEEEKRSRYYPWRGKPSIILENHNGVQMTGQATGQKMAVSEMIPAVESTKEMVKNTFPQYSFSPVYLCERGEIPVAWFQFKMPDKEMEHIKAFCVIQNEMDLVTFTYPCMEEIKWKSIILYSFGTWREIYEDS